MTAAERYREALDRAARAMTGAPLPVGTIVVAEPERAGTGTATSYPLGDITIVWADPSLTALLASVEGPTAITSEQWIADAEALGGELLGIGNQRVLDGPPRRPDADDTGLAVRRLDRDHPDDRSRLAVFIEVLGADDADEAELYLDELDEHMLALVAADGSIAAYTSARPYALDHEFDDIAVATHPAFRGRRLGALAVHHFVGHRREQAPERHFVYRCNVDNLGSNRVSEAVGFTLVHRIAAMRFAV